MAAFRRPQLISVASGFRRWYSSFEAASEMKLGDWVPPQVSINVPEDAYGLDLGKFIFRLSPFRKPTTLTDQQLYDLSARVLANAVGSVEEAKKRIYLISCDPDDPGFGAYVDKETALKLTAKEGVSFKMTDYFMEARAGDSRTREVMLE